MEKRTKQIRGHSQRRHFSHTIGCKTRPNSTSPSIKIMRKKLKKLNKKRRAFIGTVAAFGTHNGDSQRRTLLLRNVKDIYGKLLTEHIWLNCNTKFDKLNLRKGEIIKFSATVKPYGKYNGKCKDYGLTHITGIKLVTSEIIGCREQIRTVPSGVRNLRATATQLCK